MADPASFNETLLINGVSNGGPFDSGPFFLPQYPATMLIESLLFGSADFDNSPNPNDFDMKNIKAGSQGLGSSDLWAPTFTSTVVPPFDSYVGTPGDLTVSGGVITVNNGGEAAYGVHQLAAGVREIWVEYDIFFRSAMFASPIFSAAFNMFSNQLGNDFGLVSIVTGDRHLGNYWLSQAGSSFDSGIDADPNAPVPNVWFNVQYYVQITGGQNGKIFHSHGGTHRAA